jgi:capsular polysaccharide biosynthesis protein
VVKDEPEFSELAYISRRKAPSRHMRHEDEMEEALMQMGFKVYFLEELTVAEQMKAFYRAKMILAPHGAGLSHLFMAKAGTYVLEIFPADYFNDCYARLSVSLGHTYDHVICKYDAKWEGGMMPVDNILVRVAERLEHSAA